MSFKDFLKIIKPTDENQSQFYLLSRIIYNMGKDKTYRLTNVDIGLAALLKRDYKAEYFKKDNVLLINPVYFGAAIIQDPVEINCDSEELQSLLISLMKGEKDGKKD